MSTPDERWAKRLARATEGLARFKSRELMREQREVLRAKELERRALARRRFDYGEAVLLVAHDCTPTEIVGMLVEARERMGQSPTLRMAARKRGEQHMGTNVPVKRGAADAPSETPSMPPQP